jgi:anthranilate synthase component I
MEKLLNAIPTIRSTLWTPISNALRLPYNLLCHVFVVAWRGLFWLQHSMLHYIESRLAKHQLPDELGMPDIQLMLAEELAVIDNIAGEIYFIVYADPGVNNSHENAQSRLKDLMACLGKQANIPASLLSKKTDLIRKFQAADFETAVMKTKEYILAGDCMQVVIGQCISKPFTDSPLALYRALRSLNPSPYMYFYDFGDMQIVGSSPEILVR